jgi:hypothetical protein
MKMAAALLPFILAACPIASTAQNTTTREDGRARLAKAEGMFAERCKKSGEFIHRTAENVEGVFLMKVRPQAVNVYDQFATEDLYGRDSGGDQYLKSFFLESYLFANRYANTEMTNYIRDHYIGYRYVEILEAKDGKRYRYTTAVKAVGKMDETAPNVQIDLKRDPNFDLNIYTLVLEKVPAPGPAPRYGITYDDISTREEREYWIAGGSLKVIDLQTNEIIAERIGYMMDRGQGNTSGGRSPWLAAAGNACPRFGSEKPKISGLPGFSQQSGQTRTFVVKVLRPKLGS